MRFQIVPFVFLTFLVGCSQESDGPTAEQAPMEKALPAVEARGPNGISSPRWDDADLHAFTGTYGDYLIDKVSKVFPQLAPGRLSPSS